MTIVAVTGSCATTTTVALAAVWSATPRPIVIEADPTGGCLAAWLGVSRSPGLADVVATSGGFDVDALLEVVQRSERNIDAVVAPVRALEAAATVHAIAPVWTDLASTADVLALVDLGRQMPATVVDHAAATVITHRQHPATPASAVIGIERVAEQLQHVGGSRPTVVALIGDAPYGADEVAEFLGVTTVALPDDPFAAAALAGRPAGARRLQSSPLLRAARRLAATVADLAVAPEQVPA